MTTDTSELKTVTLLEQNSAALAQEQERVKTLYESMQTIVGDMAEAQVDGDLQAVERHQKRYDEATRKLETARSVVETLRRRGDDLRGQHHRVLSKIRRGRYDHALKAASADIKAMESVNQRLAKWMREGLLLADEWRGTRQDVSSTFGIIQRSHNEFGEGKPMPPNPLIAFADIEVSRGLKMKDALHSLAGIPGKTSPLGRLRWALSFIGRQK